MYWRPSHAIQTGEYYSPIPGSGCILVHFWINE